MKKKIAKKSKQAKKVNKIKRTAVTSKRATQELVIRVEQPSVPKMSDLTPEVQGSKYMIPKTWMSEKQVLRIIQKTPPQHVYRRPGKGGKEFDYVTGTYVTKVLNFTFGWNWDFEIVNHGKEANQVWVLGKLTVKSEKGQTISKTQFGQAEVKALKDGKGLVNFGNDLKSAATDSLKKCASMLGIASDIYGKEEFKQEVRIDVQENNYSSQPQNPRDIVIDTSEAQAPQNVVLQRGQVIGPDGNPTWLCSKCGDPISDHIAEYSLKVFGKRLCREDQPNKK